MVVINSLFKIAKSIDETLDGQLLEISVKRHQITISIKESMLYFPAAYSIIKSTTKLSESFISTKDDVIYFTLGGLSIDDLSEKDILYPLMCVIEDFAEQICTCPALEFVLSTQYVKCFLDKPGLRVENLIEYERILKAEGKGELELHPQRPYLLFINDEVV